MKVDMAFASLSDKPSHRCLSVCCRLTGRLLGGLFTPESSQNAQQSLSRLLPKVRIPVDTQQKPQSDSAMLRCLLMNLEDSGAYNAISDDCMERNAASFQHELAREGCETLTQAH